MGQARECGGGFRPLLLPPGTPEGTDLCHGEAGGARHTAKAVSGRVTLETPDASPSVCLLEGWWPTYLGFKSGGSDTARSPGKGVSRREGPKNRKGADTLTGTDCFLAPPTLTLSDDSFRHNRERAQAALAVPGGADTVLPRVTSLYPTCTAQQGRLFF